MIEKIKRVGKTELLSILDRSQPAVTGRGLQKISLIKKRISFEVAYLISRVEHSKIKKLIQYIDESPNKEVGKDELKKFCINNKKPVFSIPSTQIMQSRQCWYPRLEVGHSS